MRTALWPHTEDRHLGEIDAYFAGKSIDIVETFVLEIDSELAGFLELNIRNFAEGSRAPRVPYVEAWYVKPDFQHHGHGKQLMLKAEEWAMANGFFELASDTEIGNERSIALHKHLGFKEIDRVVCFLKRLNNT